MHTLTSNQVENIESESKAGKFDYTTLSNCQMIMVLQETSRIRQHLGHTVAHVLETGAALNKVKNLLPHVKFQHWLNAEFNWTGRTASRYMSAAALFRNKLDLISNLEISAVHSLAARSTPAHIRSEILSEIENGRMPSLKEIRTRIQLANANNRKSYSTTGEPELPKLTRNAMSAARQLPDKQEGASADASRYAADLILERLGAVDEILLTILRNAHAATFLQRLIEGILIRIAG